MTEPVTGTSALAASAPEAGAKPKIPLGFDNFSVSAMGWRADALIDYEQEYQKAELERSLRYCKEVLGMGLKR